MRKQTLSLLFIPQPIQLVSGKAKMQLGKSPEPSVLTTVGHCGTEAYQCQGKHLRIKWEVTARALVHPPQGVSKINLNISRQNKTSAIHCQSWSGLVRKPVAFCLQQLCNVAHSKYRYQVGSCFKLQAFQIPADSCRLGNVDGICQGHQCLWILVMGITFNPDRSLQQQDLEKV